MVRSGSVKEEQGKDKAGGPGGKDRPDRLEYGISICKDKNPRKEKEHTHIYTVKFISEKDSLNSSRRRAGEPMTRPRVVCRSCTVWVGSWEHHQSEVVKQ